MTQAAGHVAVSGAASGIGAATARVLAARGWQVILLDRDLEAARREADRLGSGGHWAIGVDVADEPSVVRAFAEIRERLGGLQALASCAGIFETASFEDTTAAIFRRVLDVNVLGTFLCLREAAPLMTKGGRICTVSSVAGLRGGGLMGTASYATSKGAILAMTKNVARVLGPRGIAVNTIAPGVIDTPFAAGPLGQPEIRKRMEDLSSFGRLGNADEIAEGIAWLLSPEASFVHGATLVADGGMVMY